MDDETKAMLTVFAGLAMHGMVSSYFKVRDESDLQKLSRDSVEIAEALTAELQASFEGETLPDD